jgi:glycosyltransferase involved in cell wall biosynthesis
VTVGLPVFNGGVLLTGSLEALLGQTYEEFELLISDNASTDDTEEICRSYAARDSRIRYVRHERNMGSAANHNYVADHARGELFKWASHDDLYGRELLKLCVDALDAMPDVVLAHAWTAMIDRSDAVTLALEYPLATDSPHVPERFRSVLFMPGGDDIYGVMRRTVVKPVLHHGSHYRADRSLVAAITLYGRFYQVPQWLHFRREHPEVGSRPAGDGNVAWPERDWPTGRAACIRFDPRRANRLLHPTVRLYSEYVWAYLSAIRHAPISRADQLDCFRAVAEWVANRAHVRHYEPVVPVRPARCNVSVDSAVAGREKLV